MTDHTRATNLVVSSDDVTPGVETIARFQALEPGSYWRYAPKPGVELDRSFDVGIMLLLVDIDMFDGVPHTIILRSHPRHSRESNFKLLVETFLRDWKYEPDGEKIRVQELQGLQDEITQAQQDLVESQVNPMLVVPIVEERLLKWEKEHAEKEGREFERDLKNGIVHPEPSVPEASDERALSMRQSNGRIRTDLASAVGAKLQDSDVRAITKLAEREAVIAETKARWLESKVAVVTSKVMQMTPFFAEKSAVALARMKGIQSYAQDIMKGLKTLNLYTGVGVEVLTLVEGQSAPAGEPLTLLQRKLFADEEIAAHIDVEDDFDFRSMDKFDERLASDPLLRDSILPLPRCVVSMAIRRREVDYGNASVNESLNAINRRVFLLVRNGENVYRVHSAEETHESTPRLFPTKNELDQSFTGYDGSQINFKDLRFTRAARQAADVSLHYKRFLVLLCGLDHRLKLFGDFHGEGETLSFISLDFQKRHMRFIADDERGSLIGEGRPTVSQWLKSRNEFLQSGSRVLCFNERLITDKTAPAAEKRDHNNRFERSETLAHPLRSTEILVAYRDAKEHCVDVRVSREGHSYRDLTQVEFNARVSLTVATVDTPWGFLCLDAVTPEDLLYYVHNREARVNHIDFIRMFKHTAALLREQEGREADALSYIRESVRAAKFAEEDDIPVLVNAAVRSWRCANRGVDLPALTDKKAFHAILSLVHSLTREGDFGEMLDRHAIASALVPLRGALTGKNRLALYVETPTGARDERLMPWRWVNRQSLGVLKTKLNVSSEKQVWLHGKPNAKETDVKVWEGLETWANAQEEPFRPEDMSDACWTVEHAFTRYGAWFKGHQAGLSDEIFHLLIAEMRQRLRDRTSSVIDLPIATYVKYDAYKSEMIKGLAYVCVSADILQWIKHFGTVQQSDHAVNRYLAHWEHPEMHGEAHRAFEPRFVVRPEVIECERLPGLYIGMSSYYSEEALTCAQHKTRDERDVYVKPKAEDGTAREMKRSLDATLAVWMRDIRPEGASAYDRRPDRVVLEPSLAMGISSVDVNKEAARGVLADRLGLPS